MNFKLLKRLVLAAAFFSSLIASAAAAGQDEESLRKGRAIARQLLSQRPTVNATATGTISVRPRKGETRKIPFVSEVIVEDDKWKAVYQTEAAEGAPATRLVIKHSANVVAKFFLQTGGADGAFGEARELPWKEVFAPFVGSDFRIIDLAYPHSDHLAWSEQRLLRTALRRGQSCHQLESVNPKPGDGGFAKVISWIDVDTGGPLEITGFDRAGKRELQFSPQRIRKVNGEYKVTELHIRNRSTGSRTVLRFEFETAKKQESREAAAEARDAALQIKTSSTGN